MPALSDILAQGHKAVGVFVWNETQRVPARAYIEAHKAEIDKAQANVQVLVDMNPSLQNGQLHGGLAVVRYHFSGSSYGGRHR